MTLDSLLLLVFWPAAAASVAFVTAVIVVRYEPDTWTNLAFGAYSAATLTLLVVRARSQLAQLRVADQWVTVQRVPVDEARRLPRNGFHFATILATVVSLVGMVGCLVPILSATLGDKDAPAGFAFGAAVAVCPLALGLRSIVASIRRPNRWAGAAVFLRVREDHVIEINAQKHGPRVARYRTATSPPPILRQPVPGTRRHMPYHPAYLVGDLRSGGWAAAVVDGVALRPLVPLQCDNPEVSVARATPGPSWFDRFEFAPGTFVACCVTALGLLVGIDNFGAYRAIAHGEGVRGYVTVIDECGEAEECFYRADFVSADGVFTRRGVDFDGTATVGEVRPAVMLPAIPDTVFEPGAGKYKDSLAFLVAGVLGLVYVIGWPLRAMRSQRRASP